MGGGVTYPANLLKRRLEVAAQRSIRRERIQTRKKREGGFSYPPKRWADRKVRPPISCVQLHGRSAFMLETRAATVWSTGFSLRLGRDSLKAGLQTLDTKPYLSTLSMTRISNVECVIFNFQCFESARRMVLLSSITLEPEG